MKNHLSNLICVFALLISLSCTTEKEYPEFETWQAYDETAMVDSSQNNENSRLRYKLIQSKNLDKNELLEAIRLQLDGFNNQTYIDLKPLIYEISIPEIQQAIDDKLLTYKHLTQWYLYRIAILEPTMEFGLNAVISINPNAVTEAEKLDQMAAEDHHPIVGMPVLLKDNISTSGLRTTAGAMALYKNIPTQDAHIVENLKQHNAIILGKVNLSEWANFLCQGCPNGYSAVAGQTLNPYGMREFDTGGSSSGSGASIAANYAVAAVGTETSGSILSPSSQHALVGMKPTVKPENQNGIVPISSTLDTPGPMTRTVVDNAILYSAMFDVEYSEIANEAPQTYTLGVLKNYLADSLYSRSVALLKSKGVKIDTLEPKQMDFSGFLELLNGDMKQDLRYFLASYASDSVQVKSVKEVVEFNLQDTLLRIPYAQARLDGVVEQDFSEVEMDSIRQKLLNAGKTYFADLFEANDLDAVLSINNYNAGQAAVARYPALTINMGFTEEGEPKGLTFIAEPDQEQKLLELAKFYEEVSSFRQPPAKFEVE